MSVLYCYRCQETTENIETANCPRCDTDDLTEVTE